VTPPSAGLIVTLPLAGYGIGLLMIVPLGDLYENRWLVLLLVGFEALCILEVSRIAQPIPLLGVAFPIGVTASAVQVLVPYVTYLAPETVGGQAVGRVVSGVMLGIMLARPVSSLAADLWFWRAIFRISTALMAALFRRPAPDLTYGALLLSMGRMYAAVQK
jgi:predicted MFS family arabinose efflux permease